MIAETPAQLELFETRIPKKPYCSDDKTARLIRSRRIALRFPYIQCNPPNLKFWLPFDLDKPGGAVAWDDAGLPAPAVAIGNPMNGHAHLLYGLEAPVATSDAARIAPMRYLAAIEAGMMEKLIPHGADAGFSGLIVKNPKHRQWRTLWGPPHLWSLAELAEWVDLEAHKPKTRRLADLDGYGVGRNVTLFNHLGPEGKWAYSAVRRFRGKTYGEWHTAVLIEAQERNGEFVAPLSFAEVQGIAKSVAKWTWKHDKLAWANFQQRQVGKGQKGGKASGEARLAASEDKRASARLMAASGMKQRDIADELGVTQSTVSKWLK